MMTTHPDIARLSDFLWQGFERLPTYLEPETCKKYLLTLFFLKAVSAIWQDDVDAMATLPTPATMTPPLLLAPIDDAFSPVGNKPLRFLVPPDALFDLLVAQRSEAGNVERVANALRSLGEANRDKLGTLADELQFQSVSAYRPDACDAMLGFLLAHLGRPECDLRPSQLHSNRVLGGVFSMLLDCFGALHRESVAVFTPPSPVQERLTTPRPIAQLMARLLKPMPGEAIFDPACGTAGLLVACVEQIRQTHPCDDCMLFGQELVGERCALSRMHLLLHGQNAHHLKHGDAIADSLLPDLGCDHRQFDVVLAVPPALITDSNGQTIRPVRGNSISTHHPACPGWAFVLHMQACLRPQTGRMAVLLPIEALSRGGKDREIREQLVNTHAIDSVICMPRNLIPGYPHKATALLLLRHDAAYAPIFFVDARSVASEGNADTEAIFSCIADTVLRKRDVEGLSRLVSWREIARVGFDLAAPFLEASFFDWTPEEQAA